MKSNRPTGVDAPKLACVRSGHICVCVISVTICGLLGCGSSARSDLVADQAVVDEIRSGFVGATDAGGAAESSQQPTGYATLRGVFKLQGTAPPNTVLKVDKDMAVCAPGGAQVRGQELIVDPVSSGIANIVIYADKMPTGWIHQTAVGSEDEVIFDQKQCIFLSRVLGMQTTQTLKILNSDPVGHNTNLKGFNQTIPANGAAEYKPLSEEREPMRVVCSIHPWMLSWLLPRKNGYFAVTAADGTFEIANLPAGVDLNFRVWQEKVRFVQKVTLNSQVTKLSKGRLPFQLDPTDESKNQIEVMIDVTEF